MTATERVHLPTGVALDVATAGDPAAPAIVLLHGFPESHRTWRHQIPVLARDHFVVAPDQRGYAGSSKPPEIADYGVDRIVGDLVALADHYALERFTLVGHDWGGAVAWTAALGRPDRIARLAILNAPHPLIFQRSLFDDPAQRRASRYIDRFRTTRLDTGRSGRMLERIFAAAPVQRLARAALGADMAAYLAEWAHPGAMTAMLNWYRASGVVLPQPGADPPRPAFLDAPFPSVTQPTLVLWGMRDRALLPVQLDGLDALVPQLTVERLPDAGHFTPWQAPDAVNTALLGWLDAHPV